MKVIVPPESCNYVEAYLTLRCPLNCSYCINRMGEFHGKRRELVAEEWVQGLNRLDLADWVASSGPKRESRLALTLGGGEPTCHPEFYDIVNGLRRDIRIDLLTNLTFKVGEFIEKVPPYRFSRADEPAYKSIRVSYHPATMDPRDLVRKVCILQAAGYKVGIFGINHPENVRANLDMAALATDERVYFFVKDFLGTYNGQLFGLYNYPDALNGTDKACECRTKELLIGPDGNVFRCHRDLYAGEDPVGSILDPEYAAKDGWRHCNHYGSCNPCDVKLKLNRFLQMGNCAVETRPVK